MALVVTVKDNAPEQRFQSFEYATVLTRRNLGMDRLRCNPDVLSMNAKHAQNSSAETPTNDQNKPIVVFGQGGIGDKSSNIWNWPLGEVIVDSTENSFQVILDFKPFGPADVSAKILGNELQIQCKTESKKGKVRELIRSYQLPMNIDPKSAHFEIRPENRQLIVSLLKSLPIKLAIADYVFSESEGSFDGGQSD